VLDGTGGSELLNGLIEKRSRITSNEPDVLWEGGHTTIVQEMMRARIEPALVDSWRKKLDTLFGAAFDGKVGAAADAVPGVLKAIALELPYLLAYRYHARDRRTADRMAATLGETATARHTQPRVAVFTDTIDDVNGVGIGLRRLLAEARRDNRELHIIATGRENQLYVDSDGIVRVPSVFDHRLAEYPEMVWSIPHLPPILRYLSDHAIDLVQCSTPGPVGIAGLIGGRLVGAHVIGQYHTDVPEYALHLTGDPAAAALARVLVGAFYRALDRVLVPSAYTGRIVADLGVRAEAITRVRRGIDLSALTASRSVSNAFAQWGVTDGPVVLYVGRLSREKSVDRLLTAFRGVLENIPNANLVVIGDGPAREQLAASAPPRTVFTGMVTGAALARLYASADVFAFPSETETFGNVVLEAQAAGLPAVVAAGSAAAELIVEAVTGCAVNVRDERAMWSSIVGLLIDPARRALMSRAARAHAATYDIASALSETFACYASIVVGTANEPAPVARGLVA
jgi:glycosyltransferase involved in cell wall biosynthesis